MFVHRRRWLPIAPGLWLFLAFTIVPPSFAMPGDTTWVHTFDHDFYNWVTPHDSTFAFPDSGLYYSGILLFYKIGCPGAPNDCDPWDRLGYLRVMHDTGRTSPGGEREIIPYEIARIVTPYDITGGNRPDSCIWILDVSDYEPLLHGEVTLRNYIESWIGGANGWLVTIDFAFIEGIPALKPFSITNLWLNDRAVYGDPSQPIEDYLQPMEFDIDLLAEAVKIRVVATGHGQGNTANCAEFCRKRHTIKANGSEWWYFVWRDDCDLNTCSPQGGTWLYDRAGWCPGDKVTPWDTDITGAVTPGTTATLDYDIQAYTNLCRPNNPDCIDGQTCADCDYNYTGHTEPIWSFQTQLIQYKTIPIEDVADQAPAESWRSAMLQPNIPNPFKPSTWIRYTIRDPGAARIAIHDASGRMIRELAHDHEAPGSYKILWNGKSDRGEQMPAGVYFYALHAGGQVQTRKMLLLK